MIKKFAVMKKEINFAAAFDHNGKKLKRRPESSLKILKQKSLKIVANIP